MRAALGLPPAPGTASVGQQPTAVAAHAPTSLDEYLQQHHHQQQQQDFQRDFQLRQLLLQDQIEHHFGAGGSAALRNAIAAEQQQQAAANRLAEYGGGGDVGQQYRQLLLNHQLQEAAQQQRLEEQDYLRQHAAALRYQDEVARRQQQQLLAGLPASYHHPHHQHHQDEIELAEAEAAATFTGNAESYATTAASQQQQQLDTSSSAVALAEYTAMREQRVKAAAAIAALSAGGAAAASPSIQEQIAATVASRNKRSYSHDSHDLENLLLQRQQQLQLQPPAKQQRLAGLEIDAKPSAAPSPSVAAAAIVGAAGHPVVGGLDTVAIAAGLQQQQQLVADLLLPPIIMRKGTVEQLLSAAEEEEKVDDAAVVLGSLKTTTAVEWSDESDQDEYRGMGEEETVVFVGSSKPKQPKSVSIKIRSFKSKLPVLPAEPLLEASAIAHAESDKQVLGDEGMVEEDIRVASPSLGLDSVKTKKVSAVLEYPYSVDTWWPSKDAVRRERHEAGETSDEDAFVQEAPPSPTEVTQFRTNKPKIRSRLQTEVEPGVLEKLNHCRIHRVRAKKKKNSTSPELVHCFQVTELYPNDVMVCCSVCGTWRHAACGGHFKQYSTRENCVEPFVAICENCHEEQNLVKQYPKAERRIERQRMEQLRRGMSTSAVMRNASYSKHSGTYKWPLGSVSATHIGGHTRSVHARHDKAERQWTDMASRLGRGFGNRAKDRVRIRTKELERLLVSIEDSESYTDRHNMLLFLLRDTARDVPIGYDNQPRNIFDPAEDENGFSLGGLNGAGTSVTPGIDGAAAATLCMRSRCTRYRRFDSLFCSDGCGVLALEMDLLRSLQDASDVHPSVLRLT